MKRMTLLMMALLCAAWSGLAAAAEERLLGYVGGQYEYMNPDSRRDSEQGKGFRLIGGYPIVDYMSVELSARYTNADLKFGNGLKDKMWALGADLALSPWRGPVVPYMLIGGGGVRDEIGGGSKTSGYVNGGVGVWVRLWQGLFARAEARRTAVFGGGPVNNATTLNDTHVGVGLQYMWFKAVPQEAPVAAPGPAPAPDLCAVDSDNDGVPDCRDKCPNTPPGFKVDAEGCIVEKQTVIMLNRVLFTLNSADLKPEAAQQLDQVVAGLKSQPTVTLEVGGHTCNIGTESYNLGLSRRRASAVRDYLTAHGIDGSRLTAEGYGEYSPIASNETEEGRQQNRRVEFRILSK